MASIGRLGKLQIDVMQVLWRVNEATSAEIHQALAQERDIAPTTVATVLRRLEKAGWVTHDTKGRQFVYRALVEREETQRSALRELATRLFSGNPTALVNCLLREADVDQKDLEEISAIIEEAKRRRST